MSRANGTPGLISVNGIAIHDQTVTEFLKSLPAADQYPALRTSLRMGIHLYKLEKKRGNLDLTLSGVQERLAQCIHRFEEMSGLHRKFVDAIGVMEAISTPLCSLCQDIRHTLEDSWIAIDYSRPGQQLVEGLPCPKTEK